MGSDEDIDDLYYTAQDGHSLVYLDITIGDRRPQRVTVELFDDKVPITTEHVKQLCTGLAGEGPSGRLLWWTNTIIDTVAKGHIIHGGNVTGKEKHELHDHNKIGELVDEVTLMEHNSPFLFSISDHKEDLPDETGFYITCAATPSLDENRIVAGRIVGGRSFLREMENLPVDEDYNPVLSIKIVGSGVHTEKRVKVRSTDQYGDYWEINLADEMHVDLNDFDTVFKAVDHIKAIGTSRFTNGDMETAQSKYQKALHYLHDYFPDELSEEDTQRLVDIKVSLYLNLALLGIRLHDLGQTLESCSEALAIPEIRDRDRTKALYRRATALLGLNNEEDAEIDAKQVLEMAPSDAAAVQLLERCAGARRRRKQREQQAMSRAFRS